MIYWLVIGVFGFWLAASVVLGGYLGASVPDEDEFDDDD
jgi:hypothetical protein